MPLGVSCCWDYLLFACFFTGASVGQVFVALRGLSGCTRVDDRYMFARGSAEHGLAIECVHVALRVRVGRKILCDHFGCLWSSCVSAIDGRSCHDDIYNMHSMPTT